MASQDVFIISVSAFVLALTIYEFGQMSMLF